MSKALIYCRVSSVRQKVEGSGLESQEHRCREYARAKGYEVEKVFPDSFTGGGDFMQRPAMRALLEYADKNAHREYVVIFDDLKRFARDTVFHWNLRRAFKTRNLKPECLNFNFEDTPEGAFIETILAAQGQLEREQNRRQVVQKMKARLERGYWPFFPPPGYKAKSDPIHGKLLRPYEPQASIIKEALEGYANGRLYEQMDVLRFLLSKNYYALHKGKKAYVEDIKRLLTRCIYAGYVEYPSWEVARRKGHHEPLISLETYETIQDRLLGKIRISNRKDIREDFPLRGGVACSVCGRGFTASWSKGRNKKFPYYRCNNSECSARNKSIRKEELENAFEALLRGIKPKKETLLLTKAIMLAAWNKRVEQAKERKIVFEAELAALKKEKESLLERIVKTQSNVVIREYEKRIEEIAKREELLREKVNVSSTPRTDFETALNRVFEILENPYSQWVNGDLS